MTTNPTRTSKGAWERRYLLLLITLSSHWGLYAGQSSAEKGPREFYKPPSPCLMGASCKNCVDTVKFYHRQVCCYHCRLDNVVINNDICHCIDTRLPDSTIDVGGNCSSGQICNNCGVKISADSSEGADATPGIRDFCCQDCGLVMPYLYRDEKGCHCDGNSQGRIHQAVPRYEPSQAPTTTPPPPGTSDAHSCSPRSLLLLAMLLIAAILEWYQVCAV